LAGLAGTIKLSDEDLRGLFPGADEVVALRSLRQIAPRAVIILTRSAAGVELYAGASALHLAALPVRLVDTIGAGDGVMGGWIFGLVAHPGADPVTRLRFALASAAVVCAAQGTRPPTLAEVQAVLAQRAMCTA
jgi:fructokinase